MHNRTVEGSSRCRGFIKQVFPVSISLLMVFGSILIGPASASAQASSNLYVATWGSDTSNGSLQHPFATIYKASTVAQPGDTVYVEPGDYVGGFTTYQSGTANARIRYISLVKWGATIVGDGTGAPVNNGGTITWDTSDFAGWEDNGSYTDIEGFDIDGSDAPGWRAGFYGIANDSTFDYNEVHDILTNPNTYADVEQVANGGTGVQYDLFDGGGSNDTINGNTVYNIGPNNVRSSLVHGIYEKATGSITNNVIYNVVGNGISLWPDPSNINIINNTVDDARDGGILVGATNQADANYITVKNNIVVNSDTGLDEYVQNGGTVGPDNTYSNNLYYNDPPRSDNLINGDDQGPINADPLFVNGGDNDFQLLPRSPAMRAGTAVGAPVTDMNGFPRPRGSSVDIGAYAYGDRSQYGSTLWHKILKAAISSRR